MENKIISINISPGTDEEINENAGVMWEHNATTLVFNIDSAYVGDYRYYIEYRSLIGTKVRTEYLELNSETNTVTYDIPVTMTSLRGVECYFNIVNIDEDGQTVQVIKPKKFCLEFDYSPGTDNEIAKVNDFSINALLEAIRSGAFKGEKGDSGEVANVDSEMSDTSTNPVQNKVAKAYVDNIASQAIGLMDSKDYEVLKQVSTYIEKNVILKEDGKGLSSNDFTDEHKDKLENITSGADGYTPVKGVDYFTEEDKEAFKEDLDIFTSADVSVSANLCDNEWEYGYLNSDGTEKDTLTPITTTFRTVNYIEVNGGEKLCHNNSLGNPIKIVQYDENKQMLVELTSVPSETNRWTENGITLNENTKYVRIAVYETVEDLSTFKLNLFYLEDIEGMFADPGDVFVYVPRYISGDEFIDPQKIMTPLTGKKIIYDGDSICIGTYGGGGYAQLIADETNSHFENHAVGGAKLVTRTDDGHSVADNLATLPVDADLYCFEGGINDWWANDGEGEELGTFDKADFTTTPDKETVCGALEAIFQYAINNFVGKPICFIITHKVQNSAYQPNGKGDTFEDYRNAMVGICNKYSIPYYDAFTESGLNGWNTIQNDTYLTGNSDGTADGCHPNEEGYKKYYVPQLISLFEKIMPRD